MPRLGQLISALLVALIGVLVVQMFLIAGMHERLTATERTPVTDMAELPATIADSPLAAAYISSDVAPPSTSTLVIVITTADERSARPDGGRALIEHFIELTDTPLGTVPST